MDRWTFADVPDQTGRTGHRHQRQLRYRARDRPHARAEGRERGARLPKPREGKGRGRARPVGQAPRQRDARRARTLRISSRSRPSRTSSPPRTSGSTSSSRTRASWCRRSGARSRASSCSSARITSATSRWWGACCRSCSARPARDRRRLERRPEHQTIDRDDLNWERRAYRAWAAYGQSELANQLFALELHRRLSAAGSLVRVTAAHPGFTATDLQRTSPVARLFNPIFGMKTADGALPTLRQRPIPRQRAAATGAQGASSGCADRPPRRASPQTRRTRRPRRGSGTRARSSRAWRSGSRLRRDGG